MRHYCLLALNFLKTSQIKKPFSFSRANLYKKITKLTKPFISILKYIENTVYIENKSFKETVKFLKKGALQMSTSQNMETSDNQDFTSSASDVWIEVRKGDCSVTISIKQNNSDAQGEVHVDKEVQSSSNNIPNCEMSSTSNGQSTEIWLSETLVPVQKENNKRKLMEEENNCENNMNDINNSAGNKKPKVLEVNETSDTEMSHESYEPDEPEPRVVAGTSQKNVLKPEIKVNPSTLTKIDDRKNANEQSVESVLDSSLTRDLKIRTQHPNEICISSSNLTPFKIKALKFLCSKKGWRYVENYTKDLTHLVIEVDEENKCRRTLKYMCALAEGKWIIGYAWVKIYLNESSTTPPEEEYEVLDVTGAPAPRRSRLAEKKLFEGISFFCKPPISVLKADSFKYIIEAAGGRVVNTHEQVRVQKYKPAFFLTNGQNSFVSSYDLNNYARILCVVPVKQEWVIDCLCNYTLNTIKDHLLYPSAFLPPETHTWPPELIA